MTLEAKPMRVCLMSSRFRRIQALYSSRRVMTEPSAFFRMVSTAGVMSARPCQSRGACRSEPNRASCTEASIGVPTMSTSTDFALAVFGWEGVVNEDAEVDAIRAECSARSDAAWRPVKPSSHAFLLERGIVDGEKRNKRDEGVIAVAVSLLSGRGLSALTSSELTLASRAL